MAFNQSSTGAPRIETGAELTEVDTETLGFRAIAGDKKLKLLPTPWPTDNLPPSSASLLSVASKRGLLAAASPNALVLVNTETARKAFERDADENNAISNFEPDGLISMPQLRHVAFSSDEDFLVVSAESGGGLAVYSVDALKGGNTDLGQQIATDQIPIHALVPNPAPEFEKFFAVILESGRLVIADVAEGRLIPVHPEGVTSVSWSVKGKALVAGLGDGTIIQYHAEGKVMATIPRPPDVNASHAVVAVFWLALNQFFAVYSPSQSTPDADAMDDMQESIYQIISRDKQNSIFNFQKTPTEICFPAFGIERKPPVQFSISRLRDWEPGLHDMLMLTASNCGEVVVLTNSSEPLGQDKVLYKDVYTVTRTPETARALLPTQADGADSLAIGQALDLSSKDKILRPIPTDEEITESPTPVPALFALNHEGLLSAWWIIYDKSIRQNTGYPGLVALSGATNNTPAPSVQPLAQSMSAFGAPSMASQTPAAPKFAFSGGKATFGAPGLGGATPTLGKPAQPAFGSTTSFGQSGGTGFGVGSGLGNRQSPWATASQTTTITTPAPSTTSQTTQNPFSSGAGATSGFAKFGQPASFGGGSTTSSFGSAMGTQSPSPFGGLGQQKSAFSGTSNVPSAFNKLSTEPSIGSTITVGSSFGNSSTLPSWANTPSQQGGSIFGQGATTSSFGSTKESDMSDADERGRDEATPTPQAPPSQAKGLFGLPTNGFKITPSFQTDGSAKDDLPKPDTSKMDSLFGNDFSSALGGASAKPPATPIKKEEEEEEPRLQDISTTPASPPKPASTLFPSTTPASKPPPQAQTPAPPTTETSPVVDDAPLPPDPTTWKPQAKPDEDVPPLAGSPAINVEAPESSVPSSPLDDDDNISVEEQDGDDEEDEEETEEPSPSDAARRTSQGPKARGWTFQDSVSQSPMIPPAAPTPPVLKSGASSRSGNQSTSSSRPVSRTGGLFGTAAKPVPNVIFPQPTTQPSATPAGFPKFAPPVNQRPDNLRSPSPVRSASTSAIGVRRQQVFPPGGTPLSSSITPQPKPPTPQPEVDDLSDQQNDDNQRILASDIEPSPTLEPFLAHNDYAGSVNKTGVPAAIERLYRDINGMVDTLGLNARSLASFIKYHKEPTREVQFTRDDLEEAALHLEGNWFEKWCLAEIEDLKGLEDELQSELDNGRVQNVVGKLDQLNRLLRDKAKVMTKLNEVRRQILLRQDPERVDLARRAALPKELADQQRQLRNEYGGLLSLLGQAEEATIFLKSKLASHNAAQGRTAHVPSVDAVKKTINKLIVQTEKKNTEISLLETQMRKLGLDTIHSRPTSSSSRTMGTPSRSTRRLRNGESPLATPPTARSKMSLSELSRISQTPEPQETPTSKGYGLYYTPEGSVNGEAERNLLDMEDEEIEKLRERARARKKMARQLSEVMLKRGIKVTRVAGQ
ncbi:hypothetical protein EJ04DRAFT_509906 [Polyplosphaeria fusca]|uniref:Nucleoporin Nup159/Nup146 N-terminal domain-containing protein n=1 Tax=Polyplosphaeria fusca TaxID=682080 RepID=A0A9P4R3A4_9PLEO|nr:hypothetical protein EJ04DRAFT_509906 [Polyplosphaeria fusca]